MSVLESLVKPIILEEIVGVKPKFASDIDGCVANLNKGFLRLANNMYYFDDNSNYSNYPKKIKRELRRPLIIEDITTFNYEECTPLNKDDVIKIFNVLEKEERLLEVEIFPDTARVINELNKHFELYLITSRGDYYSNAREQTVKWLEKNKVIYDKNNLILDLNKARVAKDKRIPIFVEDNAKTALELAENGVYVLLPDQLWNNLKMDKDKRNNYEKKQIVDKINNHSMICRIPEPYWLNIEKKIKEFL